MSHRRNSYKKPKKIVRSGTIDGLTEAQKLRLITWEMWYMERRSK